MRDQSLFAPAVRQAARSVRTLLLGSGRIGSGLEETDLRLSDSTDEGEDVVIATVADLASMLGLDRAADEEEVGRAFMDASGYETWLEIDRTEITIAGPETWQVRVERGTPDCRLAVRRDRRGEWTWHGAGLPAELLSHLEARVIPTGEVLSRRPWSAWLSMRWASPGSHRLRLRGGRFTARVVVPEVRRSTGVEVEALRIGAIGEHSLHEVRPVTIPLPCRFSDLERAVETVMRRSLARWRREYGIVPAHVTKVRAGGPAPALA